MPHNCRTAGFPRCSGFDGSAYASASILWRILSPDRTCSVDIRSQAPRECPEVAKPAECCVVLPYFALVVPGNESIDRQGTIL